MSDSLEISLSLAERRLIAKYGYPFSPIEEELAVHAGREGVVPIRAEHWCWEQVVGNLSISVNEGKLAPTVGDRACVLAERIEFCLARG